MIRRPALPKQQRDIGLQRGLIGFDGEMLMGLALDHVGRQFALSKQGVGANVTARDADAVEHGGKHPDFIGLLDLILAFYGQGADFFWVWH
jgi:hypothetical protein